MPKFRSKKWGGCKIHVFAEETDLLRVIPIVPYFWDSDINFDLAIDPSKGYERVKHTPWEYKWEICNLDDEIIKSNQGVYEFKQLSGLGKKRKYRAIKIGYLKPHQNYNLTLTLTDGDGNISEPLSMVTFTVKDRDEYYLLMIVALVAVGFAFILSRC